MGYLKSLATSFVYIAFFLAVITFSPGLPPIGDFTEYSIEPPVQLSGLLAQNERLNGAGILFNGELKGAEAFDSYNGVLYTGMHGGYVGKVIGNNIVPVVKFGKDCAGIWEEDQCGRPLGLKFDKEGRLYVVDSYYGIFKVNVATGKYEKMVNTSSPINGKVPMLPNSIDVASNGDVYWTDSSTEFRLYDGVFAMFTDPTGRLIRYNAATKTNEVLIEKLGFANGVKLSDDESYVIVAETVKSTIVKYHLKGSNAGKSELFVAGLPGAPDNIHTDGLGNYLVTLIVPADPEHPQLVQTIIPHPYIRKMIARLIAMAELPFKLLNDIYPNDLAKKVVHAIGSFETFGFMYPRKVTVLRIDGNGKVLDALHNSDEKIAGISSAFIHDGYLWLGSPYNEYLARVPLKTAFPNDDVLTKSNSGRTIRNDFNQVPELPQQVKTPVAKVNVETTTTTPQPTTTTRQPTTTTPQPTTTTPQPTTTTPKPTTTTPKPTTTTPKPTTTTTTTTTTTPKPTTTTSKTMTSATPQPTPSPTPTPTTTHVPQLAKIEQFKPAENVQKESAGKYREVKKKMVETVKEPQEIEEKVDPKKEKHELPRSMKSATSTELNQPTKPTDSAQASKQPVVPKPSEKTESSKHNTKLADEI